MKLEFKNNFIGYFRFYYNVLGSRVIINLILCIFVSFLDGIGLAMFMPLLQAVGGGGEASSQSMGQLHYITDLITSIGLPLSLNVVLSILVLLFIMKGVMKYVQLSYQVKMRHVFMKRMRYKMVDDLQRLSYRGFLKLDAGRIQNTLIAEVQRLFQSMNAYFNSAQNAVMLLTYITLAFLANYQFALLVALGAGLTNFIYRRINIATKKASREISLRGNDFNSFLMQAIHHFKYLKATNYFSKFDTKLKTVIDQTEKLNHKMGSYNAITVSIKEPMIIIVVVLVIAIQLNFMGTSLSSILLSLILFYRALGFLVTVQNHWQSFIQNVGAIYSVTEFTDAMEKMAEPEIQAQDVVFSRSITIKDGYFSYDNASTILRDINIEIAKNTSVAFVGESGSGKTTMANMIAGLIYPTQGELYVDRLKLAGLNLNSYRNKIGYISQEPVIFSDDIFNNITFWAEPTDENIAKFWKAIELASLTEFLHSLPEKENTSLGDNGILISGGQKQRISIARELYKDSEILIMDEATSALDSETEKMIQENIDRLHGKYTMVIIAHRLSTIKNVDTIYLLEKGHVSAFGAFDAMIHQSPRFKRMVSLQEV